MKNKMIQVSRTSGARHLADSRQRSYPPLTYLQMTYVLTFLGLAF